jgi:hypothetical protein
MTDRRSIIKGMALCGLAAPLLGTIPQVLAGGSDPGETPAALPTWALVPGDGTASPFLQGVRAGTPASALQVSPASGEVAFLLGFERRLRQGPPLRVIGLLEDAVATPLLDAARGAGTRLPWLGQHTAEAGRTRHRLWTTAMATGCARQLGRHLQACGADFVLDEECADGNPAVRQLAGPGRSDAHPDQWAAGIGCLLASMGQRDAALPPLRRPRTGAPLAGSFVSFLIVA